MISSVTRANRQSFGCFPCGPVTLRYFGSEWSCLVRRRRRVRIGWQRSSMGNSGAGICHTSSPERT